MIERGMQGDDLENELSKAESEINQEPAVENNEQKEAAVDAQQEQGEEKINQALEQETTTIERREENIEKLTQELGGTEGIQDVVSKLSLEQKAQIQEKLKQVQEKIADKKHLLKEGGRHNKIDLIWEDGVRGMDASVAWQSLSSDLGVVGGVVGVPLSFAFGATLATGSAIPKAIQTISRKLSLGFNRMKERKLKKQLM